MHRDAHPQQNPPMCWKRSLSLRAVRFDGLDPEAKVKDMEHPHAPQHDAAYRNLIHHEESHGHQQRHRDHDAYLGLPGHAPALDIAFQVVLVQPGIGEPLMQPF